MPCITSFWNYLGFENRNRSLSLIFYRVQTGSDFVFDLVSGWCAIGMFYNCRFCKQIVVLWEAYFVAIFAANNFILFLSTIIAFLLMCVCAVDTHTHTHTQPHTHTHLNFFQYTHSLTPNTFGPGTWIIWWVTRLMDLG